MYLDFFGIREHPFRLTPDTGYFFAHRSHQEALNVLLVALRQGEGFIKVTGEVGTGKTLLCRTLLNALEGELATAYLPNPFLNPTGLRSALADELGIEHPRNLGQHRLLARITERLIALNSAGRGVVLLIDEAQAMPDDTLEALRLLTNLETERHKLLQVVLFGQPELDQRLAQPRFRQLRQRITFSHGLQPLDRGALAAYLQHRMSVAGYGGPPLFTDRALRLLHRDSRGIPRLANVLAHKSLLAAYGRGARRITPALVRAAAADTEDARSAPRPLRRGWAMLGTVAAFAGLMLWQGTLV